MQTNTKNPLSLKTQNQEPFANGSNNVGGGVTSLLYDSKKALKLVNDMCASIPCRYYKSLRKIDTQPRNNALSLV